MNTIPEEVGDEQKIDIEKKNIVEITSRIDELLAENEKFKELQVLKAAILEYKQELQDKIDNGTPIENERFKKVLYGNVEGLLLKFIYIFPKEMRDDRIRRLYHYYIENYEKFKALDRIKERTDKGPDEVYKPEEIISDEIIIKDDKYEMDEMRNHRTAPVPGLGTAKERLRKYKVREVNPPKKFQKSQQVMDDLRFNIDRFHGKVGNANNSITVKENNKKHYAFTGQKFFSNSGIGADEDLKSINPKREAKSSYSFNRPKHELFPLIAEKQVIISKNKELAEKRNLEEIQKQLDEFGKNKARFKEQQELKFTNRNIVSASQKKFPRNKEPEELLLSEDDEALDEVEEREEDVLSMFDEIEEEEKQKGIKKIKREISPTTKTNILNKVMYIRIANLKKEEVEQKKGFAELSKVVKTNFKVIMNPMSKLVTEEIYKAKKDDESKIKLQDYFFDTAQDEVLKSRLMSAQICKVKPVHSAKSTYVGYVRPLSVFDQTNYNEYKEEIPQAPVKQFRPQSASQFAFQNFDKFSDDYLGLRKKLNQFKREEADLIGECCFVGENSHKKVESYKVAVISPEDKAGNDIKRPFSSFLPRPVEAKKKKKKKGKKKK